MIIEGAIRNIVREEVARIIEAHESLLARRGNELLTRDQVINDYSDRGITSYYKITQLEREKGLRRAKDGRPMLFRRSDVERAIND